MANRRGRIVEFLVLPLIVGLVIAAIPFVVTFFPKPDQEVTYSVDGPTSYLTPDAVQGLNVTVDGRPIQALYSLKVAIWNSGKSPVLDVPVRIDLDGSPSAHPAVFSVRHE